MLLEYIVLLCTLPIGTLILPYKVMFVDLVDLNDRFSAFWLRSKCTCYTFDFSWGGGSWVLMPGPTAFSPI